MNFNLKNSAAIAACLSTLCWTSAARADGWPISVAGTWSVAANQSAGTLVINQPSSTLNCRPINGTIFVTDSIQGFYCPFSGNIGFSRINSNGTTIQYYEGNLSQTGAVLRIGGSFSSILGSFGNYNFSAVK
ncbi:MAG: hypothetical protein V7K50_24515 [Nostoc sp.]|uniref:hypothetical protein n=1 Tax=Nostoc sp. TaxID=1180 RepID=UPI002FF64B94